MPPLQPIRAMLLRTTPATLDPPTTASRHHAMPVLPAVSAWQSLPPPPSPATPSPPWRSKRFPSAASALIPASPATLLRPAPPRSAPAVRAPDDASSASSTAIHPLWDLQFPPDLSGPPSFHSIHSIHSRHSPGRPQNRFTPTGEHRGRRASDAVDQGETPSSAVTPPQPGACSRMTWAVPSPNADTRAQRGQPHFALPRLGRRLRRAGPVDGRGRL